jgi:hypothetical protein
MHFTLLVTFVNMAPFFVFRAVLLTYRIVRIVERNLDCISLRYRYTKSNRSWIYRV